VSYDTRKQWTDMSRRINGKLGLVMIRVDALSADAAGQQSIEIAPPGFAPGDEVYSTRLLTAQEKQAIRAKIASLTNEMIADLQAAIAP